MKYCSQCKVEVAGQLTYCPLCQKELKKIDHTINTTEEDIFPDTYNLYSSRHTALKVVGFIVTIVASISILVNILLPSRTWWSLIVVATAIVAWISIATAIYKHRNIVKYISYQSMILSLFGIFLDFLIGYSGWSINFVVPIVFTLTMIMIYMLSKILHLQAGDYVIYLLLNELFGIIPMVLLLTGQLKYTLPSFVCLVVSIISVTALIIFEGKMIFQELNRRLHI